MKKLLIFISFFSLSLSAILPNRTQCKNLNQYKILLEKNKSGFLTAHPNCNEAAIKTAKKSQEGRDFWINHIESLYENHFGHPSAIFLDCQTCKAKAPLHNLNYYKKKHEDKEYIFILSVDGGGVRGIIPAMILDHIASETGIPITEIFDIFVGTSTGGLITLFLNTPNDDGSPKYDTKSLIDIYTALPKKVFSHKNMIRRIRGTGGALTARYSAKDYEHFLKSYFKNITMEQTINPVLVTSFDIQDTRPFFFSTVPVDLSAFKSRNLKNSDRNFFVWQAARATSAAPTYFKPYNFASNHNGKKFKLVDGGVGVNNPASIALEFSREIYPHKKVVLVSIGTGFFPANKKFKSTGLFGGGSASNVSNFSAIINTLMESPSSLVDLSLKRLIETLDSYYFVISPELDRPIDLASTSTKNLMYLKEITTKLILSDPTLKKFVRCLKNHISDRQNVALCFSGKNRFSIATKTNSDEND